MTISSADGMVVREGGSWTRDKLHFFERYVQAFATAMTPKKREGKWNALVYVDLLAGPGICLERGTGREHPGSPLRALAIRPKFDRLFLVEQDPENFQALTNRIGKNDSGDRNRVDARPGDCNVLVRGIVRDIPARSVGVAFVDPQGLEVSFETLRVLADQRLDILYLFADGMEIARNIAAYFERDSSPIDDALGGRMWRDKVKPLLRPQAELTEGHGQSIVRACMDVFRSNMRGLGYGYFDEDEPALTNEKNVIMYHLLFFSKHQAGLDIWHGVKQIERSGQRLFDLNPKVE